MNYKKLVLAVTATLLSVTFSATAQQADTVKRYIKVPAGYLLVLRQGDDINSQLESFAKAENIPSANFTGMGFVNVTFGFFDSAKKKFNPRTFNDVELGSFTGSIAWQEGKPSIHMHGIVAGDDFKAYGGHILKGTVGTGSLEIMVTVHDKKLERVFEKELGANVLHLDAQN
ncbi:DNA-binding protein [Pedobacter antarcticus]|uniref:PPC domain-containing DNA-binding protein n=1 Tax=Pedobacter antarcticus TaxID=34086 RepID=UPI00292FE326|nr:DNA-binding protein [Pedobacter antarcticus]